jgi:hypothetical protein
VYKLSEEKTSSEEEPEPVQTAVCPHKPGIVPDVGKMDEFPRTVEESGLSLNSDENKAETINPLVLQLIELFTWVKNDG